MFLLQKSKAVIIVVFFISLLSSCNQKKAAGEKLFAIDSLLHSQIIALTEHKAKLKKNAIIEGVDQDTTYSPNDTTAWLHEFDVFSELSSINKPINKDSYVVQDGLSDPKSNLTVLSFKTEKDLPITYVKIYYHNNLKNIKKIEALHQEQSILLKSERYLELEFHDVYNKTLLSNYSVNGGQKMFIGDSVRFKVKGSITIP